jgi:putative ABC transport system substrate-binding protein
VKRRALLLAGGAWLASAATRSLSQAQKVRRIAILLPGSQAGYWSRFDAFRAELKRLGYVEGRDISLEIRWGDDRTEGLRALAAELVALNPDVIVTGSSAAIAAFKAATSSIPVVFATAVNPVEQGFISSLQRPGGNVTGVLVHSGLTQKLVEVAREALPAARRLAILIHDPDPAHKVLLEGFESSAQRLNFEPITVRVARVEDLDRAFREIQERKAEIVVVPLLAFAVSNSKQLVTRALNAKLPLLANSLSIADGGGLLSYGTSTEENYRRVAGLVDKVLRGAKPADLPVEQPGRFQLVVNRKTAKAIGVELSPVTMLRADRLID